MSTNNKIQIEGAKENNNTDNKHNENINENTKNDNNNNHGNNDHSSNYHHNHYYCGVDGNEKNTEASKPRKEKTSVRGSLAPPVRPVRPCGPL